MGLGAWWEWGRVEGQEDLSLLSSYIWKGFCCFLLAGLSYFPNTSLIILLFFENHPPSLCCCSSSFSLRDLKSGLRDMVCMKQSWRVGAWAVRQTYREEWRHQFLGSFCLGYSPSEFHLPFQPWVLQDTSCPAQISFFFLRKLPLDFCCCCCCC